MKQLQEGWVLIRCISDTCNAAPKSLLFFSIHVVSDDADAPVCQPQQTLSVHKLCLLLCVKSARPDAFAKVQGTELPSKLLKDRDLLQVLHPGRTVAATDLCQLLIQNHKPVHVCPELWRLTVRHLQS